MRRSELAAKFQADHGRPPTPVESLQLAQQATLETREAKHKPRSEAQQRQAWRADALEVLGSDKALAKMVAAASAGRSTHGSGTRVSSDWVQRTTERILDIVQSSRSSWQVWHLRAEAHRQVRGVDLDAQQTQNLVEQLTLAALTHPASLQATDAEYRQHLDTITAPPASDSVRQQDEAPDAAQVNVGLALAAQYRRLMGPMGPSEADLDRAYDHWAQAKESSVPVDRLGQANAMALAFYEKRLFTMQGVVGVGIRRPRGVLGRCSW